MPATARNPLWSAEEVVAEVRSRRDIPPQWVPTRVDLGCGKHGCVYETADPDVVLKVTDDDTEAEVAIRFGDAVREICVRYHLILDSGMIMNAKRVMLLWRERAFLVGAIMDAIEEAGERLPPPDVGRAAYDPPRKRAETFLYKQFEAGQHAFWAATSGRPLADVETAAADYLHACQLMRKQKTSPELALLGAGMAEVFRLHHMVFGDIHEGNLGLVHRADGDRWVITDPGHVMVLTS